MSLRSIALNTTLTILSLLVTVTLVDQALRLAESRGLTLEQASHPPNMVETRDNLEFKYEFATNEQGFRNDPLTIPKPAGTHRVLVVGDSFVEGFGVDMDQTFTARLQEHYGSSSVEFINAGLSGQGPLKYKTLIQAYARKLDVDAVLLCLFANDLSDMGIPLSYRWHQKLLFTIWPRLATVAREIKHRLTPPAPEKTSPQEIQFINSVTSVARAKGLSDSRIAEWEAALSPEWVDAANKGKISAPLLSFGLLHPDFWSESIDVDTPEALQKWASMKDTLQDIEKITQNNDAELAVVYIPSVFQFDEDSFEPDRPWPTLGSTLRKTWLAGENKIEALLRQFMDEQAVTYLDMTPELRKAVLAEELPLNFRYDEHFTTTGHQISAEILESWFTQDKVFSFIK